MNLGRDDLDWAASRGIIRPEQADALWTAIAERHRFAAAPPPAPAPPASASAVAGASTAAALVAGASLVVDAWERLGPGAATLAAAAAMVALFVAGRVLGRRNHEISSGAALIGAIAAAAAAAHAAQEWTDYAGELVTAPDTLQAWMTSHWSPTLACAALAGVIALRVHPAPLVASGLVAVGWFGAMSLAPVIFGPSPPWERRALLSIVVGALSLAAGGLVDGRLRRDFAVWVYVAGLVALSGGLVTFHAAGAFPLVVFGAIDVALVALGIVLGRAVFAVFGGIGLAAVVGLGAADAFVPWAATLVVATLSVSAAGATVVWRLLQPRWARALRLNLPPALRRLLPPAEHHGPVA